MKHHTAIVQSILKLRGFKFVKISSDGRAVYYITPKNQLVRFEEEDLIAFEIFSKEVEKALC